MMDEARMGLAAVVIFACCGMCCLVIWAKSAIAKRKQQPPTYRDVINNPQKYPISSSSAALEATGNADQGSSRERENRRNHPDPVDIFTVVESH